MKQRRLFIVAVLLWGAVACQDDKLNREEEGSVQPAWAKESRANFHQGTLRIKLKPEAARGVRLTSAGGARMGISGIDRLAEQIGATRIERVFPPAGEFEARQREAGLHLWYDVCFDEELPLTRAASGLSALSEIQVVEPVRRVRSLGEGCKVIPAAEVKNIVAAAAKPFDDPYLKWQWHYSNDGSYADWAAGADINLFEAWKETTGSREVVVAVVDGGIDLTHPDLADNVWRNEDEAEGNADMDGNGYKGDVYGWNFVSNTATIKAHGHGTHVAGTVSAVNNNGQGVCGVAGGSGKGDGVRVMSCQIFEPDPDDESKDKGSSRIPAAIVYGANNGAVISQNSWSYVYEDGETPTLDGATQNAIDYFIKYAGMDKAGNQTGPMKGGIVIFAASNDGKDKLAYPAAYEKVLAVASMASDYRRAYYSNFADWVDVTAPGGSFRYGSKYSKECAVLSTYPNGEYVYLQGTSMACPHVSGVAALVVSKFGVGKPGLTPDEVRKRILDGARDIDEYNAPYAGKMGVGYVDAAAALLSDSGIAPDPVKDIKVEWASNAATLVWAVVRNEGSGIPSKYHVYARTGVWDHVDFDTISPNATVDVSQKKAGDEVRATVRNLKPETDYNFAVVGVDRFGNFSEPAIEKGTTLSNQPPVLKFAPEGRIEVKSHETFILFCNVTDPEGQSFKYALQADAAVSAMRQNQTIVIRIEGPKASPGDYRFVLTVTDEQGASATAEVPYTVLPNHAPQSTGTIANLYLEQIGALKDYNLRDYFKDEDGEILKYEFRTSVEGLIEPKESGGVLTVKALKAGKTTLIVKASDYWGESDSLSFDIMARDASKAMDLYPNPVMDVLNIRMGKEVDGKVNVRLYNAAGGLVLKEQTDVHPFDPGRLNIGGLAGGSYTLVVTYNGKEVKGSIVKL